MLHTKKTLIIGLFALALVFLSVVGLAKADSIIATVDAVPGNGNLVAGDTFRIWFGLQSAYISSDLIIDGSCTVNGKDVSSTLTDMTDGNFIIDYLIASGDTPRSAGTIPFSCSVKALQDNNVTTITTFTSSHSVSINSGDPVDTVDKSLLSSAISSAQAQVSGAVVGTSAGNYPQSAVDMLSSNIPVAQAVFANTTATQTEVTTAVTNLNLALSIFHTAQIVIAGTSVPFSSVVIMPDHSIRSAGFQFQIDLLASTLNNDMIISGECTINGVNVASSLENLTDGLYKLTYIVGGGDADAAPGLIPIFCHLYSPSTHDTVGATSFTNANTAGIDVDFISNIQEISNSATSETITFSTAVPTTAVIEYTLGDITLTTPVDAMTTTHSITISGLTASTTYLYEVIAIDASDNEGTSAEGLTFTTGQNGGGDPVINTTALSDAINSANTLLTSAIEGTAVGNYAVGSKTIFQTAITTATAIKNNVSSTQVDIDAAVIVLNLAKTNFQAGLVTDSTIDGTVDNGGLSITSITPVSVIASADGTFEHGWKWIFNVTVPFNETSLQLRFGNWTDASSRVIPVAGNMRISSAESTTPTPVMITTANTYTTPIVLSGDRDPAQLGRQIQVVVEMSIPTNTVNGIYSTTYGIQSNPNQI